MKTPGKKTSALPLLIAAGVLGLACLIGVALLRPSAHYRRYVSPPLPGGARYTFLYPVNLRYLREGYASRKVAQHSIVLTDGSNGDERRFVAERLLDWLTTVIFPWPRRLPNMLTAQAIASVPTRNNQPRDKRTGERSYPPATTGIPPSLWFRVTAPRTGWYVLVDYQCRGGVQVFERDAAMLERSLRILAPGEDAPRTDDPSKE